MNRPCKLRTLLLLVGALLCLPVQAAAAESEIDIQRQQDAFTFVVREAPIDEVFEMLARKERVSVLLGEGVEGKVSVSLFEVSLDAAVRAIAEAAGYVAEKRRGTYVIVERDEVGKDVADGNTQLRAFTIQYSDPAEILPIVEKHLSRYGEATVLESRRLIVVEDLPDFISRIEQLLAQLDHDPQQILIEAQIMEVGLDDSTAFGIDWSHAFGVDDGNASIGVRGLATGTTGMFFDLLTSDTEISLTALAEKGRIRTLSTPRLLLVEHEEAEVVIGDRIGYRVTTTINEVTTESVEFLESGVILRVTAAVDRRGRIVLQIHPEVSEGSIGPDGLPRQDTTMLTTQLVTDSGAPVFLGGLIRERETNARDGIPLLSDIPLAGRLFSRTETVKSNSETVVVLRASIMNGGLAEATRPYRERVLEAEGELRESLKSLQDDFGASGSGTPGEERLLPGGL